jgi:hypothetical protein
MLPGGIWVSIKATIHTQIKQWKCKKHVSENIGGWISCKHCGKPMM